MGKGANDAFLGLQNWGKVEVECLSRDFELFYRFGWLVCVNFGFWEDLAKYDFKFQSIERIFSRDFLEFDDLFG